MTRLRQGLVLSQIDDLRSQLAHAQSGLRQLLEEELPVSLDGGAWGCCQRVIDALADATGQLLSFRAEVESWPLIEEEGGRGA